MLELVPTLNVKKLKMLKQVFIGALLLGVPTWFLVLSRLFSKSELFSDTIFVKPGRYGHDSSEILEHLDQYCVYERGSISAPRSAYIRYCEIREGDYKQLCTGNGDSEAQCSTPNLIHEAKPQDCQVEYIQQRFYSQEKDSGTLFSNCASRKQPPKSWRDTVHISQVFDYNGKQKETIYHAKFPLTH